MQDIDGKETELRDTVIDGTVRKAALVLDKTDKRAQIVPRSVFREFMEDIGKEIEISADVSGIRLNSMASEATEGDHLPENR